ncbi:MAG: transcriptional regulator [Deltaproteobacteria bacterium]|nr:transcriptional regulator [Deltaproteobacteria bacterium]
MQDAPSNFHERLIQARVQARQTLEGMAVLLGMSPEEYEGLEGGRYPKDDTLKRLCTLMDWNFYDAQRIILNEMISPRRNSQMAGIGSQADSRAGSHGDAQLDKPGGGRQFSMGEYKTFGQRLKEARNKAGQTDEILAMLLGVDLDTYRSLEGGGMPSLELLRRICMAFGWNYNDVMDSMRSEQNHSLHPRRAAPPPSGQSMNHSKLKGLMQELDGLFLHLADPDQKHILIQMELVRDTMRRLKKAVS